MSSTLQKCPDLCINVQCFADMFTVFQNCPLFFRIVHCFAEVMSSFLKYLSFFHGNFRCFAGFLQKYPMFFSEMSSVMQKCSQCFRNDGV